MNKLLPSDINTKEDFWDSYWKNCEAEMVAKNLVLLSKRNNNQWLKEFTWNDYVEQCDHAVNYYDGNGFDKIVKTGCIDIENKNDINYYSINSKFIEVISRYQK